MVNSIAWQDIYSTTNIILLLCQSNGITSNSWVFFSECGRLHHSLIGTGWDYQAFTGLVAVAAWFWWVTLVLMYCRGINREMFYITESVWWNRNVKLRPQLCYFKNTNNLWHLVWRNSTLMMLWLVTTIWYGLHHGFSFKIHVCIGTRLSHLKMVAFFSLYGVF